MAKKGKAPGLTIEQKLDLHFEVDDEKVAQIKRCLEKGKLSITVSKVDLSVAGRTGDGYLYD